MEIEMAATEGSLVWATWGLVVVTAILVAVNMIPLLVERRRRLSLAAARLVPDMHFLKTRLGRRVEEALNAHFRLDEKPVREWSVQVDKDLELLAPFMEVRDAGLELVSEVYVCRHLLISASLALWRARVEFAAGDDPEAVREQVEKATRCYRAGVITLDKAESLLPSRARRIESEVFGERFSRVTDEREADSAKWIAEQSLRRSKRQGDHQA